MSACRVSSHAKSDGFLQRTSRFYKSTGGVAELLAMPLKVF